MTLPAPQTKHLGVVHHLLPGSGETAVIRQVSGKDTTGTTLWLGGQVLAAYLASLRRPESGNSRPVALELGAGTGFLALTLAQWYDVIATDVEPVLSSVLLPNVAGHQNVTAAHLDWVEISNGGELPTRQVDILVTADTVYASHLTPHLWNTISRFCDSPSPPTVYLALERRDPRLVDQALQHGRDSGFELRRVAHGRIAKAVERAYGWKGSEWADVEVWKGKWRGSK